MSGTHPFSKHIFTIGEELDIGIPSGTLPDIPDQRTGDTSGMPDIPPPTDRRRMRRRRQENAFSAPLQKSDQMDTPTRAPASSNSSSSGQ